MVATALPKVRNLNLGRNKVRNGTQIIRLERVKANCYFCNRPAVGIITIINRTPNKHTIGNVILEPKSTTRIGVCQACVQEIEPTN